MIPAWRQGSPLLSRKESLVGRCNSHGGHRAALHGSIQQRPHPDHPAGADMAFRFSCCILSLANTQLSIYCQLPALTEFWFCASILRPRQHLLKKRLWWVLLGLGPEAKCVFSFVVTCLRVYGLHPDLREQSPAPLLCFLAPTTLRRFAASPLCAAACLWCALCTIICVQSSTLQVHLIFVYEYLVRTSDTCSTSL